MEDEESDSEDLELRVSEIVKKQVKTVKRRFKDQFNQLKSSFDSQISSLSSQFSTTQAYILDLRDDLTASNSINDSLSKQILRQQAHFSATAEKVEKSVEEFSFLRNSLVHLTAELPTKASVNDLQRVESAVAVMCPMIYAQKLEADVRDKADGYRLNSLSTDFQEILTRLESDYVTKEGVMDCVQLSIDKLTAAIRGSLSLSQFTLFKQELERILHHFQTQIQDLTNEKKRENREFAEEIENLKKILAEKADFSAILDLKDKIENYALNKNLNATNELSERNSLRIENLSTELEGIFMKNEAVLQRYDEILLDKANKTAVSELEMRISQLENTMQLKPKLVSLESSMKNLHEIINSQQTQIADLILKNTENSTFIKRIKSEKRDFQWILSSMKSLEERILLKADRSDLTVVSDSKSSKAEVAAVTRSLEVLNRVDRLLIMLLQHTIKCLVEMKEEVAPVSVPAIDWLFKHAEMVAAWASLYEPIENEVELPPDIMTLLSRKVTAKAAPLSPISRSKSPLVSGSGSGRLPRKLLFPRFDPRRVGPSNDTTIL